ncbi:MAG: hypothetical protein ACOYMF_17980 [Bacteroidales bacterium]
MNKLKTDYAGGFKVRLNDIRWEQAAVREAFYGLMSAFGITASGSFKLSGCDVTIAGSDYSCAAGYISFMGEICKVDAHTTHKNTGESVIFAIDESYDATGDKTFLDLTTHQTYLKRKAKLISSVVTLGGDYMYYDAPSLGDVVVTGIPAEAIQTKLVSIANEWHLVGETGEPDFQNGWYYAGSGFATVAFMKETLNDIVLKGYARNVSPDHGAIFTLPAGYRPAEVMVFTSVTQYGSVTIYIQTNGDVYSMSDTVGYVVLDGIRFKTY